MTVTCRDIVRRALRKLSRVAAGQEPDANDMADAMETLQAWYLELVGLGLFGKLYDVTVTGPTFTAYPQMRVIANDEDGVVVTLPTLIDPSAYYATCYLYPWYSWFPFDGVAYDYGFSGFPSNVLRPPRDGSCIEIHDLFSVTNQTWIFEGAEARWIQLQDLNPSDTAPLGAKYSEGIASILAVRLADEYSVPASQTMQGLANRAMYALGHRYDGQQAPTRAEYF